MNEIKKFLIAVMLVLFMPIMIVGCGENNIAKIYAKTGTMLTTWEVNKEFDYSTSVFVVEYEDGAKKEITPQTEGVEITNIDTSTSGEKFLKIKYGDFETEIKIMVYDDPDQAYQIAGFEAPVFVADYLAKKSVVSTQLNSGYLNREDKYYVGDDNAFEFLPNITVYKSPSLNALPQKLNKYKSIVKVEMKDGDVYKDLTDNSTPTLNSMVMVDNVNSTFDFTDEAVGKEFKIIVSPYYAEPEDEITPISFEFVVKDGYNVYDACGLSVLDNNRNTAKLWADKKKEWGVPTNYNPAAIYLHGDIKLKVSDFPEEYFINEYEAGNNKDNALGSLKQRISLYSFESPRNKDFEICGNYFKIDASSIPLVVRDANDATGHTDFYKTQNPENFDIMGHSSLISFGGDNTQFLDDGDTDVYYVGNVNIKNISMVGNSQKSQNIKYSGGLQMIISGSKKLSIENMHAQQFTIMVNGLGNWDGTGVEQDDNNDKTNDNEVEIRQTKCYDAFTTMFYVWGTNMNVYDSILMNAGGPLFMAVHYGENETDRKFSNVNLYDTEAVSLVSGQEAWFSVYKATEVATGFISLAEAIKLNAVGIEDAVPGIKFEKNTIIKDGKFNFVGLLMSTDIIPDKNEVRGAINLYKTIEIEDPDNEGDVIKDYKLVGCVNSYVGLPRKEDGEEIDTITYPDYAKVIENTEYGFYKEYLKEYTVEAPLFQNCTDGARGVMATFVDTDYNLGVYGVSFGDCLQGSSDAQAKGLDSSTVMQFYRGDYMTIFPPCALAGLEYYSARMGALVEFYRVD